MITRERLEELIEQGVTIYTTYGGYVSEINLDKRADYVTDNHLFEVNIVASEISYIKYTFNILFETKEDAEFVAKYHTQRPEYFEPPTYDIVEKHIKNMKRFGLNHNDKVLVRIITVDSIYYLRLCKDLDLYTFDLRQTYIGDDLCEQITSKFPISLGKATKENYYKAVEKARKLFLGESDKK